MNGEEKYLNTRRKLVELRDRLGVRPDWHEPDQSGVTAEVRAGELDNAMLDDTEAGIVILQDGEEVARVNLAMLLAWATGWDA